MSRERLQMALAGLAHEVRTPLNGIMALAELLAASDLPARERQWATALTQAAEHIANLTAVIVDGARAQAGTLALRRDLFDPELLARMLAQSLAARADAKGLAVELNVAETLPRTVVGDPVLLRAAIENLLDNAVKFTERGTIHFSVAASPLSGGKARLGFAVADEGIGLTAAELRRLFRPFAQANAKIGSRYGGAGLGLAFARQIARAMGGDLTAESEPGRGSRFRLEAEFEIAPAAATMKRGDGAGAKTSRALRILCAEDSPYGRVMLNTIVSALGHGVDFVSDGDAAVKAASGGGYDLVLMDVVLPGLNGVEATRRIRALPGAQARLPIIGISGRSDAAEEKAARQAGMTDYLVKPVSAATLARAIAATQRP